MMKRESGIKLSEVRSLLSSEEETKVRQRINNSSKKICNREISFFTAAFNISKPGGNDSPPPPLYRLVTTYLLTYLLDLNPIELPREGNWTADVRKYYRCRGDSSCGISWKDARKKKHRRGGEKIMFEEIEEM